MYLDIAIGIVLLLAIGTGIKNGMYVEFISIFGLGLNIILTKTYTPTIISFFKIKDLHHNYVLSYIVVFISLFLFIKIVLCLANKVLKENSKGIITRGVGGIIGFAKGVLLALVLLLIYNFSADLLPSIQSYSKDSVSNQIFAEVVPQVEQFIPDIFVEKLNDIRNMSFIEKTLKNQRIEYENN